MDDNSLANLIAKRFIARTDVKAVQRVLPTGECIYTPHLDRDKKTLGWDRASLLEHISGEKSYGHYLLNQKNECKFFAFDVDLEKTGSYPVDLTVPEDCPVEWIDCNPREVWKDRAHPGRPWMKMQLRSIAGRLAAAIYNELEIPVAVYYSGGKGVHVYGFTGLFPAYEARVAARIVLESMGCWELKRGNNFFQYKDQDNFTGYPNLSLEVFPKQDTIDDKSGLGNLMRAPMGRNLKNPKDPTFFVDLADTDMSQLKPLDPGFALTTLNAWERP